MNFEVKTVNQIKYYFYLHYLFLRRHVKSSRPEMYYKKGVVKIQNSQENTCARVSLLFKL